MYKKLIALVQDRKVLELELQKKRGEFEKGIALESARLSDLKEEEEDLRLEVLNKMKQENIANIEVGDNKVIFNTKVTRRIVDPALLMESISNNQDDINILLEEKETAQEICEKAFQPEYKVVDKDKVNEVIDKYYKVNGVLLEGVEDKATEFLTVK